MTRTARGAPRPPARPKNGHKGTFGTVIIVGGCADGPTLMLGAPALSARAALRVGAGLTKVVVPREIAGAVLTLCPSATASVVDARTADGYRRAFAGANLADAEAVVFGPGMGRSPATLVALKVLLATARTRPLAVVIDADGLFALAALLASVKPDRAGRRPITMDPHAHIVLTPHVGEGRTLASAINPAIADKLTPRQPITAPAARDAAVALRSAIADLGVSCTVILKGSATIIAGPDRTDTISRPNPALATAGTGDVLAGTIAGLLAQAFAQTTTPRDARRVPGLDRLTHDMCLVGVRAHALAAERWCKAAGASAGLLALELADLLPSAIERLRRQ